MKNPWIIIGLVTVALFVGAFFLANQAKEASNVGIEITNNIKGNPNAVITLEEFSDFQCPACGQAHTFVNGLVEEYQNDISFEYKHFPIMALHPYALQAGMAAEAAAQQGQFYAFHDKLFENQSEWSSSATPNVLFENYAKELGMDVEQFKRQSTASALREKVMTQMNEGRERGVTGTPSFFLNGELIRNKDGGAPTLAEVAAAVAVAVNPEAAAAEENPDPSVVGESTGETVRFGI